MEMNLKIKEFKKAGTDDEKDADVSSNHFL